jgi:hypothetical protein
MCAAVNRLRAISSDANERAASPGQMSTPKPSCFSGGFMKSVEEFSARMRGLYENISVLSGR